MNKLLFFSTYLIVTFAFIHVSFPSSSEVFFQTNNRRFPFQKECESNRDLVVAYYSDNKKYEIKCEDNYSLYNAKATIKYYNKKTARDEGEVQLLNFNLFHPGKSSTRYKDYKIIASIMNRYDVVSGLELLGSIGSDNKINFNVLQEISRLKGVKKQLEISSQSMSLTSVLESFALGLNFINKKVLKLATVYKKPGYLKIFEELQKLDPSWSLIISAQGESRKAGDVQELVGFYFKAKKVKLFPNQYCKEIYAKASGSPYACTPQFGKKFLGIDAGFVFSRRPFMANFESGNFDFTMLASHVVFRTPKKTEKVNKILKTAFDLNSIADLKGSGARLDTYARFAEVKLTLDLIKRMKKVYSEKDIIFTGDFNLEANNKFWKNKLMSNGAELKLLIKEKTSLAKKAYLKDGTVTGGYSSNYDHFMINVDTTSECDPRSAKRVDFIRDEIIKKIIDTKYTVRNEELVAGILYSIHSDAEGIISDRTEELITALRKEKKILHSQIVPRYTQDEEDLIVFNYHKRVFASQMSSDTYYRVYTELVSDHAPISLSCSTNGADDDRRK